MLFLIYSFNSFALYGKPFFLKVLDIVLSETLYFLETATKLPNSLKSLSNVLISTFIFLEFFDAHLLQQNC